MTTGQTKETITTRHEESFRNETDGESIQIDMEGSFRSYFSHGPSNAPSNRKDEGEVIAKTEGKLVFWLRMLVMLVLVLSAIGVSISVYRYSTHQETEAFETKFNADCTKVLESIGTTFEQTLGSTDAFITQLVQYARYSGSEWPFVTMPKFAISATKLLKLSKAFYFSVYPFVEPWQRDEWERYAKESEGWIYESLDIQAKDEDWHGEKATNFSSSHEIYCCGKPHTEPFEYMNNFLPSWQVHPMAPSAGYGIPYNYDLWSVDELAEGIIHADEAKRVVVSPQVNAVWDPTSEESIAGAKGQSDWAANYAKPDIDTSEPFSVITFPIYDSLETVKLDLTQNHTFVGILTFSLYWRELLTHILPPGSDGLVLVFEDPCSPAFTYRLDGPVATYLGQGDLHDPKFDHMRRTATLPELANPMNRGKESSSYTGLPISETYCPRSIHVYPSTDMENDHSTQDPLLFTIMAASIFFFTSAIFIMYDFWVNRRQQIVLERALQSGAIVNSLFPSNVQKQLYEEQQEEREKEKALNNFQLTNSTGSSSSNEGGRPIADHYENTTIFFADLVGFTAWSSKRTPVEVFDLLENIYGRFDQIALRRKVFKVETIGDCYVAATGIPNPQSQHAQIMARFADDCMRELHEVTAELAERLGEDTRDLAMRCGLHSGSVTAGVLRGEKGRFQLFGDSVNTAARMEHTGVPGRIHVSQEYADALRANGKAKWLQRREDKVVAKGLGELTTYWVAMRSGGFDSRTLAASSTDGSQAMQSSQRTNSKLLHLSSDNLLLLSCDSEYDAEVDL